jgi:predicted transporter
VFELARIKPPHSALGVVGLSRKRIVITVVLALMLSLSVMPSFAQSIDFDASVLISQVNTWITIFLPILSIGMGISIAIALVEKVGASILNAFRR